MAFWISGRDRHTGQATDPFFSEADREEDARGEAEAQGLIVDSIERAEASEIEQPPTCLRCGSQRVVLGRLHPHADFRPVEIKFFRLSLDSPDIDLKVEETLLCVECGLVWTVASGIHDRFEKLRLWGRPEMLERLGLTSIEKPDTLSES